MRLRIYLLAALLLLAGCAARQPEEQIIGGSQSMRKEQRAKLASIDGWQIDGKLGYKASEQAGSGTLFWLQRRDYYDIRLAGPIGIGAMHLTGHEGAVTLEVSGQGSYQAESPEALLAQQLGWQLPVSHLFWWVRGLAAPDTPGKGELDSHSQFKWLLQDGWQVDYLEYIESDGHRLPSRLRLFGPEVELTLVIKQWKARQLGE